MLLSTLAALTLLHGPTQVSSTPASSTPAKDPFLTRAQAILKTTPLIDGHNDVPWAIPTEAPLHHRINGHWNSGTDAATADLQEARAAMVAFTPWRGRVVSPIFGVKFWWGST